MTSKVSKSVNMSAQCPFCGGMFDYTMYPVIHIPGDSKLKKMVLNKTLFFPTCPHCREELKLRPRCMYINDTKEDLFIVTDDPEETVFETILTSGDIRFSNIHTDDDVLGFMKGLYKRRLVRDVDTFREKIILSDNNYDDRIIELMKLSLSELIEKESHTPVYRIFLEDTAGGQLEFAAIMGAKAPYDYITIKSAVIVYNQYRDKYLKNLGRPKEDEYIFTDQKWAKKSGLLKDEDAGFVVPM